jgi:predicted CXXCH cytochrome family protein
MVRRLRTAKKLGTRHDLSYFKRWTRGRRWKLGLSVAIPVLALTWLVLRGFQGDSMAYSSGPMSHAHAVFGKECSNCHANMVAGIRLAAFKNNATDSACLACHQAPSHHADQAFTPTCASCHTEHTGAVKLAMVADQNCVQCHADLKTRHGAPRFEKTVTDFNNGHPEFAALRGARRDAGTIALNHVLHMRPIDGPHGKVQLECGDCHRFAAEAGSPWRFAEKTFDPAKLASTISADADYMLPPTYERTCAACHELRFDPRVKDSVPHDKPEMVRAFMLERFKQLSLSGRAESARAIPASASRIRGHRDQATVPHLMEDAEELLWRKTCKQCHTLDFEEALQQAGLPRVLPANMPAVWNRWATFSHDAHQALDCSSCHTAVAKSKETSDVLIPSIQLCRNCHNGDPAQGGHAENRCFECHQYHDWKQRAPVKGRFSIKQWTGRTGD